MAQKIRKGFFKILPWSVATLMIFTLALGIWQSLPTEPVKAAADDYEVTNGNPVALPVVGATSVAVGVITLADVGGDDFAAAEQLTVAINAASYPNVVFDDTVTFADLTIAGTCGHNASGAIAYNGTDTEATFTVFGGGACAAGETILITGLKVETLYASAAVDAGLVTVDNDTTADGNPRTTTSTTSRAVTAAVDATAAITFGANSVVGTAGVTTITLTTPFALDVGDQVLVTFPAYVDITGDAEIATGTIDGGTATVVTCDDTAQVLICTVSDTDSLVTTGTIILQNITTSYLGTTDITVFEVEDEGTDGNEIVIESTVALTDVTAAALQATVTLGENAAGNLAGVTTITIVSGLPFVMDPGDTIDITFPSFIDISGPAEVATGTFDNGDVATITCDDSAQVLTCTVSAANTATTGTIILQNITSGEEGTTDITVFEVEDEGADANNIAVDTSVALTDTTGYTALTGGSSGSTITAANVNSPNGSETWVGNSSHNITWVATGSGISKIKLSYSLNGGSSYPYVIAENEANDGAYAWTVPNVTSGTVKVQVEALSSTGSVITSDVSNANFSITGVAATFSPTLSTLVATPTSVVANGTATTTVTVTAKDDAGALLSGKTVVLTSSRGTSDTITPATATTSSTGVATFTVKSSTAGMSTYTATVNGTGLSGTATVSFTAVTAPGEEAAPVETPVSLSVGDLIKSSLSTSVYYYGSDNKRHLFPNEKTYKTWYTDWSGIKLVPASQLQGISLGANVTVRPGTVLLKIETDPKVYAVEPSGLLRWVPSEARALALYGTNWNKQIIDVPLTSWTDYTFGTDLTADKHPTGALIKYDGSANVYYVSGAEKRLFAGAAFESNRFQTTYIETISASITYTNGTDITGAEAGLTNIY
ncbi:hypothetical protein A2555_02420 [Candidatus Falkowbacteria bacterium RIFOXYD2_FULL_39_16]|nr:MAG: hypothetical protein A2555_02420 [Candidatus Falkowbacteria bacterium RIFOXYD2_FULL_39_16]